MHPQSGWREIDGTKKGKAKYVLRKNCEQESWQHVYVWIKNSIIYAMGITIHISIIYHMIITNSKAGLCGTPVPVSVPGLSLVSPRSLDKTWSRSRSRRLDLKYFGSDPGPVFKNRICQSRSRSWLGRKNRKFWARNSPKSPIFSFIFENSTTLLKPCSNLHLQKNHLVN